MADRSVDDVMDYTRQRATQHDVSIKDCQQLLLACLEKDRSWLLTHGETSITCDQFTMYVGGLRRLEDGEPLAYVLGQTDFWESTFALDQSTLIPRPDTELLVDILTNLLPNDPIMVMDAGTGSGAIAVSLARTKPAWTVLANDKSHAATLMALTNATGCNNVRLFNGDWLDAVANNSLDVLVSNPPYIRDDDEHLANLHHEPMAALVSGPDGLNDIRRITADAVRALKPGGYLLLEHGYDQQPQVIEIMEQQGFNAKGYWDLAGQPRAVLGQLT